jgi:hypothetical protein
MPSRRTARWTYFHEVVGWSAFWNVVRTVVIFALNGLVLPTQSIAGPTPFYRFLI